MRSSLKFFAFLLLVISGSAVFAQRQMYCPWPPRDEAVKWEIRSDNTGQVFMKRHYPYGVVDRWLTIFPGNDSSKPQSGTCRFPNGFTKEMTEGELAYFWDFAGAKHAWEQHRR